VVIVASFGDETLRALVVQACPRSARLESSAPAAFSWLFAVVTCPSNPPDSALPPFGHRTVVARKSELTVVSLDAVTSFGPGALQ
jgi:hypothetical protein